MPLCGCTDALAAIAVWSPFVKTAAPMTKTSASTCAPFVALTEKFFGKLFSTEKSVSFCWFCMVIAPFVCSARRKSQQASITIPQKTANIKVFCNFFNSRHFRPALFPAIPAKILVIPAQAGINSPQGGECCGVSRVIDGDFISPSFSRLPRESIGDNAKALSAV